MSPRSNAILDLLRGQRAAVASVFAMSIKAAGALLTIAVFTLAARALSADEFGQLAIWFNALSLLAVAAVFGQDTLIARSWGDWPPGAAPARRGRQRGFKKRTADVGAQGPMHG